MAEHGAPFDSVLSTGGFSPFPFMLQVLPHLLCLRLYGHREIWFFAGLLYGGQKDPALPPLS
jgi:hypothetical protein